MEIIISIVAGLLSTVFFEPAFISCLYYKLKNKEENDINGDLSALFETKFFLFMQIIIFILTSIIAYVLPKFIFNNISFYSEIEKVFLYILLIFGISFVMHLINSLVCGYKTVLEYLYPHLKWIKLQIYFLIGLGYVFALYFF